MHSPDGPHMYTECGFYLRSLFCTPIHLVSSLARFLGQNQQCEVHLEAARILHACAIFGMLGQK